jgi:hypothetical protein
MTRPPIDTTLKYPNILVKFLKFSCVTEGEMSMETFERLWTDLCEECIWQDLNDVVRRFEEGQYSEDGTSTYAPRD